MTRNSHVVYWPLIHTPQPYIVKLDLKFPDTMPDFATAGADGTLLFQMAPAALVPYGVYYFLELVHDWKSGAWHRMAGHVLQVSVGSSCAVCCAP